MFGCFVEDGGEADGVGEEGRGQDYLIGPRNPQHRQQPADAEDFRVETAYFTGGSGLFVRLRDFRAAWH